MPFDRALIEKVRKEKEHVGDAFLCPSSGHWLSQFQQ